MDEYVLDIDITQEELDIIQEITREVVYNECDFRRALHKLIEIAKVNKESEVK